MSGKMYEKRPEEDARYHDTWRLLKKYRDVTWSLELSIRQVKNQFRIDYDCSIEDFLESIYTVVVLCLFTLSKEQEVEKCMRWSFVPQAGITSGYAARSVKRKLRLSACVKVSRI